MTEGREEGRARTAWKETLARKFRESGADLPPLMRFSNPNTGMSAQARRRHPRRKGSLREFIESGGEEE